MDYQADSEPFSEKMPSGEISFLPGSLQWDRLIDGLPLGVFIVSGRGENVKFNEKLGQLLNLESAAKLDEGELWDRLRLLGADRRKLDQKIKSAREGIAKGAGPQFDFLARTGQHLDITLFDIPGEDSQKADYGGWIQDISSQTAQHNAEIETLVEICGTTRIAAAGAAGNLEALVENLRKWNPDVAAEVLVSTVAEMDQVQASLDLALGYAALIQKLSIYRQPVMIAELLADLLVEQEQVNVRTANNSQSIHELPPVEIDPALTKLAVEELLDEVLRHNPAGLQIDAVLVAGDDSLVLKFISPRTLPLPGLGTGEDSRQQSAMPIKLRLAREMLASQGVKIVIHDRPLPERGGADLEIHFPLAESFQQSKINLEHGDQDAALQGRILLAEAQADVQVRLREELLSEGYRVDLAGAGSTALDMVQMLNPDLVILARNLPGMDGLLVTQGIRRWSSVPIIMISGRSDRDDQLYAYRLGVDDYLQKPLLVEELLAKVRVFLTRQQKLTQASLPEIYESGSVRIDHSLRQVWIRGKLVELTPIEYNLLLYLSRQGRQIVTYEQLMESVWEGPEKGTRQGLFVHVRRLRKKIELDPKEPKIVKNKWGVGYVFNP
ncbi:MAG: response regulator [Anaerolineales bacterium]